MPLSPSSLPSSTSEVVLRVDALTTRIGGVVLHRNLAFDLRAGEVLAVVGASGSGKSVLLRTLLRLMRPAAGRIEAFGQDIARLNAAGLHRLERRGWIKAKWGASENNRKAKYYELTKAGRRQLESEQDAWEKLTAAVAQVLGTA